MALPTPFQLYLTTGSFTTTGIVSNHGLLSDRPNTATSSMGWNVGSLSIPRVVQMDLGVEVARTSTNPPWNTTITGSGPNNFLGDSYVFGPLNGDFDGTNWQITSSFKAVTLASTHLGRLMLRFYKAASPLLSGSAYPPFLMSASFFSGSNPLTNSFAVTSISPTFAAAATINVLTASFNLGPQQFRNEFLMMQVQFNLTTIGGGNNADLDFVFGPTASVLKTAQFTAYNLDAMRFNGDDFG